MRLNSVLALVALSLASLTAVGCAAPTTEGSLTRSSKTHSSRSATAESDDTEAASDDESHATTRASGGAAETAVAALPAEVNVTGTLDLVDVNMNATASQTSLSSFGEGTPASTVAGLDLADLEIASTTTYELIAPAQGDCPIKPSVSIASGKLHFTLASSGRGGDAPTLACHEMIKKMKGAANHFQARFTDAHVGTRTVHTLAIDFTGAAE